MTTGSPAKNGVADLARELPAGEGRVVAPARQGRPATTFQRRAGSITQRFAGAPALTGPPCGTLEACDGGRLPGHQSEHLFDWQPELAERDPEGGLEADHPRGRLRKRHLLGLGRVRRVVGGDGVDRAVQEPGKERSQVGRRCAAAG